MTKAGLQVVQKAGRGGVQVAACLGRATGAVFKCTMNIEKTRCDAGRTWHMPIQSAFSYRHKLGQSWGTQEQVRGNGHVSLLFDFV